MIDHETSFLVGRGKKRFTGRWWNLHGQHRVHLFLGQDNRVHVEAAGFEQQGQLSSRSHGQHRSLNLETDTVGQTERWFGIDF